MSAVRLAPGEIKQKERLVGGVKTRMDRPTLWLTDRYLKVHTLESACDQAAHPRVTD